MGRGYKYDKYYILLIWKRKVPKKKFLFEFPVMEIADGTKKTLLVAPCGAINGLQG
jgi:hypothetical protein